jgi:hypothetical protein
MGRRRSVQERTEEEEDLPPLLLRMLYTDTRPGGLIE